MALGLILIASVRRRRHDLALLKTLGFTQRQLASVLAWQASVAAVIGFIVFVFLAMSGLGVVWVLKYTREEQSAARSLASIPETQSRG